MGRVVSSMRSSLVVLFTLASTACTGSTDSGPVGSGSGGSAGGGAVGGSSAGGSGGSAGSAGSGGSGGSGGSAGSAGSTGSGGGVGSGGSLGSGGNGGWGPSACPAPTTKLGYSVGDTLGDVVVVDCDTGAPRSLEEVCGASAAWVFVAHSHCPTCKATAGFTASVAQKVAAQNIAIAHIMYDDNGTSCADWKKAYSLEGISNVKVYEDPTGAAWTKLKTSNYTAPSVILSSSRVISHQEHGMNETEVLAALQVALGK